MLCNDLFTKSNKDMFAHQVYTQLRTYFDRHGFEGRKTTIYWKCYCGNEQQCIVLLCNNEGILP